MIAGAAPPERFELGRFENRISFLYAEQCVIHRDSNAVTLTDDAGTVHVPAGGLAALLLGPGTRVTHAAMSLLGTCGVSVVWVGEHGVRYYAHGRPLSSSSRMAELQAKLVSNTRSRLTVARAMYRMRFGEDPDVSRATMSELRGYEGARIRRLYRQESQRTGVPWTRRSYDPADFDSADPINQALTAATSALYGVVHAAVVSMGCVPSLGFIHTGTDRAFVFDVADLYKAETAIPVSFDVVASGSADAAGDTRRAMRDVLVRTKLFPRIVRDISRFLGTGTDMDDDTNAELGLWSEGEIVEAGKNYALD